MGAKEVKPSLETDVSWKHPFVEDEAIRRLFKMIDLPSDIWSIAPPFIRTATNPFMLAWNKELFNSGLYSETVF